MIKEYELNAFIIYFGNNCLYFTEIFSRRKKMEDYFCYIEFTDPIFLAVSIWSRARLPTLFARVLN